MKNFVPDFYVVGGMLPSEEERTIIEPRQWIYHVIIHGEGWLVIVLL
jgi:hypothetical protein